jgi:hypothetical protein
MDLGQYQLIDLEQLAAELRKKQQEQQERYRKEYRDRFWSKAQDTPTRPDAPMK